MQPCSSLLTMDLVQSSTAFLSFLDMVGGSLLSVRSSSLLRIASALARSACIESRDAQDQSSCESEQSEPAARPASTLNCSRSDQYYLSAQIGGQIRLLSCLHTLMVGTVARESRHDSKSRCSSANSTSASRAACCLLRVLAATTCKQPDFE